MNIIKQKFFPSCNCILSQAKSMVDLVKLQLLESYCLPILLYATAAVKLSNEQLSELNAAWNSAYRRIFGFNKWESVRQFTGGLGRLDFVHTRLHLRLKFCKNDLLSSNHTFAHAMRAHFLSIDFKKLCFDSGMNPNEHEMFSHMSFSRLRVTIYRTFNA